MPHGWDAHTRGPGLGPLPSFRKIQRLLGSYQPCSLREHSLPSAELSELADRPALLRSQHLPCCGPFRLFMATPPQTLVLCHTQFNTVTHCGSLNATDPHKPTGSGIIRRYGFVGASVALLEEVRHHRGEL